MAFMERQLLVSGTPRMVPLLERWQQISVAYITALSAAIQSDGCTKVAEIHHCCCVLHDLYWRTGVDEYGDPITTREANARFRRCNQQHSLLGRFSPMAWWRWVGVSIGALFLPHTSQ